jgi:hypothetical protein
MGSTIDTVTVTYTCEDCSEQWDEEYQGLSGVDESPEHPDCTYAECDQCGCTCEECECDGAECDECGCGEAEDEKED